MWGRRRRQRERPWPGPEEIDAAIEARRATWPPDPPPDAVVELAELLTLRGLRDLEVRRPGPAAGDLREATGLLDSVGASATGTEGSRVRTAWIARARCEAILGHVDETVECLGRLARTPPRIPSEHRGMIAMLEHPLRLEKRLRAAERPSGSREVHQALVALLDRLARVDETAYGRLRSVVAGEPAGPDVPGQEGSDGRRP